MHTGCGAARCGLAESCCRFTHMFLGPQKPRRQGKRVARIGDRQQPRVAGVGDLRRLPGVALRKQRGPGEDRTGHRVERGVEGCRIRRKYQRNGRRRLNARNMQDFIDCCRLRRANKLRDISDRCHSTSRGSASSP